ncbi:hypothetical protein [Pyxidicoccus trucidator]|uniref:hypothetical protein n=1 Tax=Pyxidicoccus trucidator TaxID=2709662 RepID=UPI0013D8EE28|nr:hypothetical protein [Pyxidicoccus trucidator]
MKRVKIVVVILAVAAAIGAGLAWRSTSFRSEQFLISGRLPRNWTSRESPGSLGFSVSRADANGRSSRGAGGVSVVADADGTLDRLRNRPPPTYQVAEVTIDTQPALQVQTPTERSYYVKNPRGDLLNIRFVTETVFDTEISVEEIDGLMSSLRFLPAPTVAPEARFVLRGEVRLLVGDCMPSPGHGPGPSCKQQKVRREVVVRGAGPGLSAGDVVARVQSDEDGDFELELPPGRYHLFAIEDGKEWCKSTGPYGPCGVRIIDRDIEKSVEIDRAVH